MAEHLIKVQVAYARPDVQMVLDLDIRPGTTAREALRLSALPALFPEIDCEHCPLGIFGRVVHDDHVLRAADRLEVYRPLEKDPREARREMAARDRKKGRSA